MVSMKDENVSDKRKSKTVTLGLRVTPENRDLLDRLVELISEQLGTRVSRVQAFNIAVKEAVRRREKP